MNDRRNAFFKHRHRNSNTPSWVCLDASAATSNCVTVVWTSVSGVDETISTFRLEIVTFSAETFSTPNRDRQTRSCTGTADRSSDTTLNGDGMCVFIDGWIWNDRLNRSTIWIRRLLDLRTTVFSLLSIRYSTCKSSFKAPSAVSSSGRCANSRTSSDSCGSRALADRYVVLWSCSSFQVTFNELVLIFPVACSLRPKELSSRFFKWIVIGTISPW
ncbi:hypothetical protein OGAPHI_004586 [Ogataea philodendri]|uniref:Uncharacterized protein n=1 Tax=Ogataea philodendri TaxID=1378263 RepID=A0A9P8T3I9_9ASCO|nr:uncharacterized protein OGAPHI_004586 [Ogataea philodendri]KAH3664234.1 hypothetical protein OGAPHI_004586 [Ogataea philodendri]